ncbi:MAG: type III polyketide synthase [Planctomycetota bacterium]
MIGRKTGLVTSHSRIAGLGLATPAHRIGRTESVQFAVANTGVGDYRDSKMAALYRRTGIDFRGTVLVDAEDEPGPDAESLRSRLRHPLDHSDRGPSTGDRMKWYQQFAGQLASEAAVAGLTAAAVEPEAITHLVVVTCTGFASPGVDYHLMDALGLPADVQRIQVGFMGCHGAINGLRAVQGICAANPSSVVLMVCVELCSLHYQYGPQTDRIVSGALFADGAAALVAQGDDSENWQPSISGTASYRIPGTKDDMTWHVGDHGFEMTLRATVPGIIEQHLPEVLCETLGRFNLSPKDICGWAVHPGGVRIVDAVKNGMKLNDSQVEDSLEVLRQHGNMSSPTMLFVLERFIRQQIPRPWLMLGFGPGLAVELAVIE